MKNSQAVQAALTFRASYRQKISRYYYGCLHAGFVFTFGLCTLVFFLSQVSHWTGTEASVLAASLLFGNFAEYAIHRWLGHKKQSWAKLFYARHSGDHHHFFVNGLMTCDSKQDWRVLFFPPWLIVIVTLCIALPLGWVLSLWLGADAGWAWAGGVVFTYLAYESLHYSYHLPARHWLSTLPGLALLRRRHIQHHDPKIMHHGYFNITLPLFDYLLNTHK